MQYNIFVKFEYELDENVILNDTQVNLLQYDKSQLKAIELLTGGRSKSSRWFK